MLQKYAELCPVHIFARYVANICGIMPRSHLCIKPAYRNGESDSLCGEICDMHTFCRWRCSAVSRVSDLRLRGRGFESRAGTRRRNPGQVSHTCVPLFTKQYKLVPAKLRLGSKGKVWFVYGWQVKLCDPLITHGPYLSALEVQHDKVVYKSTFTLLYFTFGKYANNATIAYSHKIGMPRLSHYVVCYNHWTCL